jgi:hypothetical protein
VWRDLPDLGSLGRVKGGVADEPVEPSLREPSDLLRPPRGLEQPARRQEADLSKTLR